MAIKVTIALVLFNFVLSSHFLFMDSGHNQVEYLNVTDIQSPHLNYLKRIERTECEPRNNTQYKDFIEHTWKLIDLSMYALVPFFIMLTSSVIIIIKIAQQSKKFSKPHGTKVKKTKLNSNKNDLTNNNNNNNCDDHHQITKLQANKVTHPKIDSKFSTRTRNLALMLIPVNVMFLLFVGPVVIAIYTYEKLHENYFALLILEVLNSCNFTVNFFIYFLTSSKFREEFFKFINETLCFKLCNNGNAALNGNRAKRIDSNEEQLTNKNNFNKNSTKNRLAVVTNDMVNRSTHLETLSLMSINKI
jgi:hypothetical protein